MTVNRKALPRDVRKGAVDRPVVSVIIPTFNCGRFLTVAIQSVLDQTYQDWELIVVDDGSVDDTREVVAAFQDPRIRYVYQENRGAPAALNAGVLLASGEYIAFLGADDRFLPEKLALQVAQLQTLPPSVGLVYSDLYLVNLEDGAILGRFLHGRQCPRGKVLSHLLRSDGAFIHPCSTLIRSEVFDEVGLLDEGLRTHEDWDLWVRIAMSYEIEAMDVPLGLYGRRPDNLTNDFPQMHCYGTQARLKILRSQPLAPKDRRALIDSLAAGYYHYGLAQLHMGNRKEGLGALWTSLRLHPAPRRYHPHAALLLVSPRLYAWLRAARRWLTGSKRQSIATSGESLDGRGQSG